MHPLRPLLLAAVASSALSAQAAYSPLFAPASPSPRAGIHGVSDGTRMWVFGGLLASGSPPVFSNEMWHFDGAIWTNATRRCRVGTAAAG